MGQQQGDWEGDGEGATCLASAKRSMINPGQSLMTLLACAAWYGDTEQLHLFADTFQAPKMQPHPVPGQSRACAASSVPFGQTLADLVGCARACVIRFVTS